MAFPVDVLTNVDHGTLELTAEEYMSQLPYRNTEYFSLSDSKQIEIGLCNVSFVPLYGTDTEKKLLALFSPDDSNTVVGVYLLDRWWRVEDVLKTAEPSRTGLIKVSTLGERIVLYVLNRIVLRNEKSSEDVFFLCHCEHEAAKILWKDGEAIGFYSFKPKGSLCRNFVTQCYQLPVMDTIFVRKCHRGQGHAIKILEDFVGCFRNEYIGFKFPLSEAMYKVCEKYFSIYPADKEFLWEVEKTGSPFQRTLIANRLQKLKLKEKDQVVSKLNFDEDDATAPMETEFTKIQETTEYTVEIVEETIIGITKDVDGIPFTRRGRGSNLKRRAIRENSEERLSENVIREEDIEAGVESSVEVAAMENLNTFSVKESETVLRSSVDTVTATVTNFAEFRGSQKEETHEIEKDIVTATSEEIPVTHLTTAAEINNQRGSKEECEMVIKEYTIDIQGATIGSIDQSQLQSVVDIEIKMSAGTEEEKNENLGKNKEVEEDEPVCEAEMEEIKQMPDEPKEEKTVSKTEVAEQSETHAKSIEKVQAWDVEITENKERAEDEVMAESEKDLIEDNRDDNTGQEKSEPKDKDTVLQQSVEVKDQIEMEADSVREVLTTEEVLCDQPKQNEAETEVSEPKKTMTNKDTLIEKASNNKLGPDEAEQVFNKSKLPQKRTSGLTPSRRSKRLRHQPAEKYLKTTKSAKTGQQISKHHSKVMMQDEDIELSTDEPEHDVSEVMEKIQEAQIENKAEAEAEVEEYKEKDVLTVETVSTMDAEITQVEETVFPEVSELVEREETDQEEAPLQSSVEPPEIHESKTTPEEDEETVQNSTVMLTLSEAKVVLVDLHELSPKEAGDNHGEIGILEQEEIKLIMSSEQQATEENTKPMEEPACTTTTEGYDVAADANRTQEQSTAYKDEEYEPESETTEVVLLSKVEKPEKPDFEQTGVTVRYLRSTLNPVKITPVRRSTRSKAVIQQVESVEPQVDAKLRTDENPEREKLVAEDVSPEENENANKNADETASVECGSSELLRAAEIDDKEKEHQITKVTGEIPLIETEAEEDVLENRVEEFKKMENKEANLAGQMDSDIEMSSLAQEVHVQEEEVPISTERHLRHRTIRVQTPLIRKSRCIQKQKAEAAVEHQERHTVVSKNKTDTILMTKETEDKMDQDVNKMENKEEHFAELEPVEEPNMSRNEYEKTSAITEETVDVCIPIITTKSSLESLDEMVNTNTEETAVPERSELPLGVEIDYQEKEFQIVDGPEEKVSLVEPDKEVENDNGTPVIKLQRPTVVLVDLSKLSQNTEGEGEASEDLTHLQTEEKLEQDKPEILEEEASVSTERSLRRRTIKIQSSPRRKSRRLQKQEAEAFEDKTRNIPIRGKVVDEMQETLKKSTVESTEVIPFVEAEPEDDVVEKGVEEIKKMEDKETNLAVTKDTDEETPEVGEEANLEQQQNEPLDKNDKETAETETSKEIVPVVGKEQTFIVGGTTIQIEEKVSQVSLAEAEPDEEGEKIEEEKLEQDKPDNSEYQLCNLTSEEEEQLEQLQKEKDTEKTPEKDKIQDENTVEEQNEPDKQDMTFEEQRPIEDLEEQNDLKVTEIVEVYRAVDENVEEAVNSGEHPEKTTTMADETNIIQEAEKYHNITLKEKQTDSDIEISGLGQEAPETVQEILEEEASVSTERSLRCRTIKIQSPPRRKSRRLQKQEAEDFEDKTRNIPIRGKVVDEMQETLKKSTVESTEVIPFVEAEPEDDVVEKGVEEMKKMEDKETNLAVTKDTDEETPEVGEEANLEQQQNDPLGKNDKETAETETSKEIVPVVGKEQTFIVGGTTIQIEEKVSQVSLVEAEPDEEVEKDDGTPVIQLQKATVVLVDLNKRSQNTEGESDTPEVLTHSQTEEKLEQDKPDNSEYQLCNLTSEEEEQQEQLQKAEDTEKTPEKGKIEYENTVEEQNEPDNQDMTFEEQKPTEDLEEQNDLKVTEVVEVYRAVDENVEEAVNSGEHPEKTTTEAEPDEEGEKDDGTPVIQLQIEPVVSKEQAHIVGGTTIQIEEKFSQGESTETDQSDNEMITRRSLRLSAKSVTATQKKRKSTHLHKVDLDPVKERNMSRNEHEETSATTEENVCMPIITVESNMESLDEMTNTNVEETTAVAPETSELLMGKELNDKEEASQIVEEDKPTEAEPHEEAEKDDGTPVILQKDTLLLVDLNKLSQNTEEQTDTPEVLTPDNSEYHLCNLTSEEDKQDMKVEGQKPTDDLVGQNDGKERANVEEYKVVIDEDVEESVSTGEHPKATTMKDKTNINQETENNQDISLKEKQMDSDREMRSLGQEAPEDVQEILEEEASVSTERSLRRRTVKIQSPPIKKSRRVKRQEAEVFEDKTGTVQLIGKGDEEVHKEGAEIDKEETLQKTTVEATENIVSLIEGEPDENVKEKGFEEINNMENKETNLGNEMERVKVNLEQQENEPSVENENETAETEKPMGMDEVSVVNKEQTYGLEETTIQAEEEILQIENSETNENKNERTTRRSLRISSQSDTSTQKTRKAARLHKAELEPVKEAKMSLNEETSSMTANTVNVSVPVTIETNVENLDEDGDVSKRVETTSDEQDIDISNDKGRVDEALPEISTDIEEDETMTLIKITENEILVEMDKTKKDVEGGVPEEEKAEPSQENTEQEQEEAVSLGENMGETDLTNEFKTKSVEEKVALENSEQEAAFITRSLRYRTVTVQSTPRSKSKRLHRQELESEREIDDLNVPIGKDNEALIAEDSTAEFENLETKELEGVIQTNTDGKSEKSETKDDTKEVGNEILFEVMESNSGSQVNAEQNKSQEKNLEREDMPVPNEQEEDEVSSVQKEAKPLQERENEGAAEGSTADLEETAVERRSLRKRMTVETADPRKSKRLRKQEHEDDSEQVKQAVMGQTDSVEVTFTEDSVELRSDATGAVFEGSNLGEEILQKIQKNAQGAKSDGDCNVHKDTEPDAGESQEEQKQSRINQTQADEDQEEVMADEIVEEVIEQHVDLESSTNEGFALALEVEETSDQEENKADEESRVVMEDPKEIFTSAEKYEKGEENISDDDEKGLPIGKHVVQSSSITASTRRKSMRLQMHESKTKEDESNSETEVDQTAKQRHQRKRKAITDSTSARRSKRHVRARIV